MLREPEFYVGSSHCFCISYTQHKQVNLTLCKICVTEPTHFRFCGRIYDKCTGKCLENVSVSIEYSGIQCIDYTNLSGQFCFVLPCCVNNVSIALRKKGYIKRYIDFYPITDACDNDFYLHKVEMAQI